MGGTFQLMRIVSAAGCVSFSNARRADRIPLRRSQLATATLKDRHERSANGNHTGTAADTDTDQYFTRASTVKCGHGRVTHPRVTHTHKSRITLY